MLILISYFLLDFNYFNSCVYSMSNICASSYSVAALTREFPYGDC